MNPVHDYFTEQLTGVMKAYADDAGAMTDEQFAASPGGKARPAADYIYEVAYVNDRVAMRMRGEDPGPWPYDSWVVAPDEFRDKTAGIRRLQESVDGLMTAWNSLPDNDVHREIQVPNSTTSPFKLMHFTIFHMAYHDGQLNYQHALNGDDAVHWS